MNKIYPTSKRPEQRHTVSDPKLRTPSRKNGQYRREHIAQNKNHLVSPSVVKNFKCLLKSVL